MCSSDLGAIAAGFQYYLPSTRVVQVTGTDVKRMAATKVTNKTTHDVRYVITRDPTNGETHVFRNEDTRWGWPPYFKFDSSDLQAEAAANISPPGQENWVVITHYGWRNRFLSIYPNAVGIRQVEGPDVRIIPWFNIFFFVFFGLAALFVRAAWLQFRERMMDPALEKAGDRWDEIEAGAAEKRSRLKRWFARLGGK